MSIIIHVLVHMSRIAKSQNTLIMFIHNHKFTNHANYQCHKLEYVHIFTCIWRCSHCPRRPQTYSIHKNTFIHTHTHRLPTLLNYVHTLTRSHTHIHTNYTWTCMHIHTVALIQMVTHRYPLWTHIYRVTYHQPPTDSHILYIVIHRNAHIDTYTHTYTH